MKNKEPRHPSGLTMVEWRWPFKTEQQRKKVAAWVKRQQRTNQPEALL